jgi:predicted kinase
VVADLLRERGVPYAWIDVDMLRRAYPTAADDPLGQAVALDHLEAMAGVLRRRGYRHVVLAEVIERAEDRELYERAFDGAELAVVRLEASEATRIARVTARERDPWRDWHLARTVELATVLQAAGVDDAVVDNDGERPLREVAAQVLAAAGWE